MLRLPDTVTAPKPGGLPACGTGMGAAMAGVGRSPFHRQALPVPSSPSGTWQWGLSPQAETEPAGPWVGQWGRDQPQSTGTGEWPRVLHHPTSTLEHMEPHPCPPLPSCSRPQGLTSPRQPSPSGAAVGILHGGAVSQLREELEGEQPAVAVPVEEALAAQLWTRHLVQLVRGSLETSSSSTKSRVGRAQPALAPALAPASHAKGDGFPQRL